LKASGCLKNDACGHGAFEINAGARALVNCPTAGTKSITRPPPPTALRNEGRHKRSMEGPTLHISNSSPFGNNNLHAMLVILRVLRRPFHSSRHLHNRNQHPKSPAELRGKMPGPRKMRAPDSASDTSCKRNCPTCRGPSSLSTEQQLTSEHAKNVGT
jgi:hypothetical protein